MECDFKLEKYLIFLLFTILYIVLFDDYHLVVRKMKSKNITLGVLLLTLFTAEFMISPSKADSGQFIYPPPTPIIIPMGQYYNISWEPLSPIGPSPPLLEGLYDVQYYNEGSK